MRQSVVLISLLASTTLAQDVVSFFWPGGLEGEAPLATIKMANPSTTAMHIACPTGVDSTECGWGSGADIKLISGTSYEGTMSLDTYTVTYNCDHNTKAVEMTCTAEMTGEEPVSTVLSGSDIATVTATVTKGAELLRQTASASATAASVTASMTSNLASATSTGTKTSASVASSASAAVSSQASSSASTPTASGSAVAVSTGAAAGFGIERSTLLTLVGAAAVALWY